MAEVLNELGYYNQAIGVIQDCFDKTYRHYNWLERGGSWQHEPYDALSVSYYWVGDYQASYDNVLKALEYCPSDGRILYNHQVIEAKLNETKA
jgi:tetratricopeptide (TPR) repeat protein